MSTMFWEESNVWLNMMLCPLMANLPTWPHYSEPASVPKSKFPSLLLLAYFILVQTLGFSCLFGSLRVSYSFLMVATTNFHIFSHLGKMLRTLCNHLGYSFCVILAPFWMQCSSRSCCSSWDILRGQTHVPSAMAFLACANFIDCGYSREHISYHDRLHAYNSLMKQYLPLLFATYSGIFYCIPFILVLAQYINFIIQEQVSTHSLKNIALTVSFYQSLVLGFGSWGVHWAPHQKSGNSFTLVLFFLKMHSFWNKRKSCFSMLTLLRV